MSELDVLELEARRVSGVMAVGFETSGDDTIMRVLAPFPADADDVARQCSQLARTLVPFEVDIKIDTNEVETEKDSQVIDLTDDSPTVTQEISRVELGEITRSNNELSVHLSWKGKDSDGSLNATTLADVAEATLLALDQLELRVPYHVRGVMPVSIGGQEAIIVVLRSAEAPEERLGIAIADDVAQATARATLDALNRYLTNQYGAPTE